MVSIDFTLSFQTWVPVPAGSIVLLLLILSKNEKQCFSYETIFLFYAHPDPAFQYSMLD
jgi:hypothetical protein